MVLFGSYARGEFGRSSDVDLLILFGGNERPEFEDAGRAALAVVGEIEVEYRLPMHLSAMLGSVDRPEDLGPELIHALGTDGVILYGRANALVRVLPTALKPWTLVRFSAADAPPADRVRLSRRLHGTRGRPGIVRPPGVTLGRGALMVPASQRQAVRDALDEAGALYDFWDVWRDA